MNAISQHLGHRLVSEHMPVPTLRDIANATGVSVSTVSRALSGGQVNEATRQRIEHAATDLGYQVRPNSSPELTIGVVVTDLAHYYVFDALTGISATLLAAGHRIDLTDLAENEAATKALLQRATARCDGVILMAPRIEEQAIRDFCDPSRTVITHRRLEPYPSVTLQEMTGMHQALRHLASLGHRKLAYVSGPEESWSNHHRQTSFVKYCEELNLEPATLGPFQPSYEGGVVAGDTLMMSGEITAVIAYNDLVASGLVSRLSARGLSIPGDISVVGMDDSLLAQVSRPQLTSVQTFQSKIGKASAQLLLKLLIHGESSDATHRVCLTEGFVVRDSTATART